MSDSEQILIHGERALEELDQAMSAGCQEAAQSHAELSALHFERAQELRRKHRTRLYLVEN